MVHNGIEYGLMQAYAEGFDILKNKNSEDLPEDQRFTLNIPDISEVWRRGSVVSSWLLDLSAMALAKDHDLSKFSGYVQDSGEGRWTVEAAIEEAVPADVLTSALYTRFRSRQDHTFAERMLSAMRFGFGGHVEGQESLRSAEEACAQETDVEVRRRTDAWPTTVRRRLRRRWSRSTSPKPADPCAMVLFGATGDLAKRLVVPALYNLAVSGTLPEHFALIGVARGEDEVESWRKALHDALKDFVDSKSGTFSADHIDEKVWRGLSDKMSFVQGDLTTPQLYTGPLH